ncbi:hypothetical protein CWE12_02830 [Aliidiomarina sedimenti]|uniref:Calcineurin-like phosphoesterase domain-containing protein n=1 Tax=Aliidiomarina sedimenti TaxID=1933879 RepID=A0ABY0C267_9GAMM|nr:metallophosphoesterase [Aliidiomarina sedimenti]RUO31950.1 hypothetical protein CWE12_02830 [Aliidiomarina sedimenti]
MSGWQLANPVRRVKANLKGRDLVVGDIHGCFDLLQSALDSLAFDERVDRLFSVGDLIDRGPDSIASMGWLGKPWFYACLGNHESVLLDYLYSQDEDLADTWCRFGGEWFFDLSFKMQTSLAQRVLQHCSYAVEISDQNGHAETGIVHADVPVGMSWSQFTSAIGENSRLQYDTLWARERGRGLRSDRVEGVRQVVAGHQIVQGAHQSGNVWLIDTGAYRAEEQGGELTVLELPDRLHHFSDSALR